MLPSRWPVGGAFEVASMRPSSEAVGLGETRPSRVALAVVFEVAFEMTAKARHAGFEVAVVGLGKASGFRGESAFASVGQANAQPSRRTPGAVGFSRLTSSR